MNQDLNIIKEYLSKIPKVARDAILSDEWNARINEISKKYSLNTEQSSNLNEEVLFAAIGIEPEEDLKTNLKNELVVSDLLAEQLAVDIEQRVFSWIDKIYNSKIKTPEKEVAPRNVSPSSIASTTVPNYTPQPKVILNTEEVQAPVPVPRFKAIPLSEGEVGQNFIPNIAPKPSGGGIMESKLKTVTDSLQNSAPKPASRGYSVDPYREPLA